MFHLPFVRMRFVPVRHLIALSLLTSLSGLTGCATILGGGGSQEVGFTSTPPGAQIHVVDADGKEVQTAITPCRVNLNRGRGYFVGARYTVHATVNGYPDRDVKIDPSLNPWYAGNLVFGGLIGMLVVDPLTGAMYWLPNEVKIDFGAPSKTSSADIHDNLLQARTAGVPHGG
jgi:hypothetical protein